MPRRNSSQSGTVLCERIDSISGKVRDSGEGSVAHSRNPIIQDPDLLDLPPDNGLLSPMQRRLQGRWGNDDKVQMIDRNAFIDSNFKYFNFIDLLPFSRVRDAPFMCYSLFVSIL